MDENSNYQMQPCIGNRSMSMQELSDSIEEIITTPDIYAFYNLPYEESPMSQDQNLTEEIDQQLNTYNNTFNAENNTTEFNNNALIEHESDNAIMYNEKNDNLHFNNLSLPEEKFVKKFHINSSDLISVYCSKCKQSSKNYMDSVCCYCNTELCYRCCNCNKIYKKLINIQNHIKYDCLKESIFYCSECHFTTPVKNHLIRHIQNEHRSLLAVPNTFQCTRCQKTFIRHQSMLAHKRVCGLEPTLQCKYCLFKTKYNSSLTVHVKLKHPEFDQNNYHHCPDCGKKYKKLSSLNQHIRMLCGHIFLYECDHCDYRINRKYALARHMQKNHPELYFKNKFLYESKNVSKNTNKEVYKSQFLHNVNNQNDV